MGLHFAMCCERKAWTHGPSFRLDLHCRGYSRRYLLGAFAFTYWSLYVRDAQAFTEPLTQLDSFYFATATFTTTGYADIAPIAQAARLATSIQMVIGFALVAVILAVALSQRERKRET
jgi:hypothetical protein